MASPCDLSPTSWSLVAGSSADEQWPAKFVPLKAGLQLSSNDAQAVTKSAVGALYSFTQKRSIYGAREAISFSVLVNEARSELTELCAFLKARGTASPIKAVFPNTGLTANK